MKLKIEQYRPFSVKHLGKIVLEVLLCCYFSVFSLNLTSQNTVQFSNINQKEGLASRNINTIVKDSDGFIWIGTDLGLNRYDGQQMISFRFDPGDPQSLNGNSITTIFEDSKQNIWIGTYTGANLLDKPSGKFKRVRILNQKGQDITASIATKGIYEDPHGNIWISTGRNGLFKLKKKSADEELIAQPIAYREEEKINNQTLSFRNVIYAEKEYLWIGTTLGIDRFHIPSKKIERYLYPAYQKLTFNFAQSEFWDGKGNIIFRRGRNFSFINIDKPDQWMYTLKTYINQVVPNFPERDSLIGMLNPNLFLGQKNDQYFWFDLKTGNTFFISEKSYLKNNFPKLNIKSSIVDQAGNIWLGTNIDGLKIGSTNNNATYLYLHNPNEASTISQGQIRSILKDDQGYLWVATLRNGLDQFKIDKEGNLQKLRNIKTLKGPLNEFENDLFINLHKDKEGAIWVASTLKGVFKLDPQTLEYENFNFDPQKPVHKSLSGNRIWGLEVDSADNLWIGTWQDGLNYLNPKTREVKHYKAGPDKETSLLDNAIRTLLLEGDSILWIGTGNGLNKMDLRNETFTAFQNQPEDPNSLSNNLIWTLLKDRKGNLWVGTNAGLNKFDPITERFERYFELDGLVNNTVYGLLEDKEGKIWINTANGLGLMLPGKSKPIFKSALLPEELDNVEFLPKAHFRDDQTGMLYFGNEKGLLRVNPELLKQKEAPFKPAIHSFVTYTLKNPDQPAIKRYYLDATNRLKLSHRNKIIEITLSDLSYDLDNEYEYEYKLIGFNLEWTALDKEKILSLTNLSPGNYTFSVRRKNINQEVSPESKLLSFKILPPWWQSWWAYGIYFLSELAVVYGLYRLQLRRQLQKQESENLKVLNAFKNELYTNITHEFRTPLTVISGMAEQIKGQDKAKSLIKRNALSLLDLVNQILDLRRMEIGKLKLELTQGDVIQYLQYIMESYTSMGAQKGVQTHFIPKERTLVMDFDQEKLLRVVSNLLSNAIKFTPKDGHVYFIVEKSEIEQISNQNEAALYIRVSDTGIGIPKEEQAYIFDRFYQVSKESDNHSKQYKFRKPDLSTAKGSSGIGLALTKDLVELMGGTIEVESSPGKGSSFIIHLPISQNAPEVAFDPQKVENLDAAESLKTEPETQSLISPFPAKTEEANQKQTLLIIEDNEDVQEYLISILESRYELLLTKNGQEGIDMAIKELPDLIVSDVMMPIKDGFEVCETLRGDDRTSHIPIVLLTAKSGDASRIEGFSRGADAYLSKPFQPKELLVRLNKLNELRQLIQERYKKVNGSVSNIKSKPPAGFEKEDVFVGKLRKVVEDHLDNYDFGPSELCREMGMSRSQLHLKIKALTSISTSIFIRKVRLNKAKELLQKGELNVTQVAYEVGFRSLSYFSTKFSEEFGMQPSEVKGS